MRVVAGGTAASTPVITPSNGSTPVPIPLNVPGAFPTVPRACEVAACLDERGAKGGVYFQVAYDGSIEIGKSSEQSYDEELARGLRGACQGAGSKKNITKPIKIY